MIERSLLYIYTAGDVRRFVGCGVLIEGSHVATCRHVWRDATEGDDALSDAVLIEFPHFRGHEGRFRTRGTLTDPCETDDGLQPDLVLLAAATLPSGAMALQLAADAQYETGEGWAQAGLPSRARDGRIPDATIHGIIGRAIDSDGCRQFTGHKVNEYWFEPGSSGSPLFLTGNAQQLVGIASLSELRVNDGESHLHEAFVIRGQTIREHVRRVEARKVAQDEHISAAELRTILAAEGLHDVPLAEIPGRLREFLSRSRAHGAESTPFTNAGEDVDAAIGAARRLVGELKAGEALELLRSRIDAENDTHTQRLLPYLREALTVQRIASDQDGARITLAEIVRLDPDDAWAWFQLGDAWMIAGDTMEAARAYAPGRDAATRLGDERDIAVSHGKVGDVLRAQGDGPGALTAYRDGLAIAEALTQRDPANTVWQRDLSGSQDRIGNMLRDQGDGPGALTAYRDGLAIRHALAQRDPANTEWQRDLSVSQDRIGDVLRAQGDGPGALTAYRDGLAIAEALAQCDPANTVWQRDLFVSHTKVADVLRDQGDGSGALAAYRDGLAIAEALVQRDPANTGSQRDLSVSYIKVGDVLWDQGDGPGALTAYRDALAIREALAQRDPANTEWQRDLSVSYIKVGDVLRDQGDGPGTLTAYRNSLAIREALAQRDPANTEWQRDLSVSQDRIGDVLRDQGDESNALTAYRNSLAIAEDLAQRDPANTEWQRDLIISHIKLAETAPAEVKHHLRRATEIVRRLYDIGRLAPIDHWMVAELDRRLAKL